MMKQIEVCLLAAQRENTRNDAAAGGRVVRGWPRDKAAAGSRRLQRDSQDGEPD